MRGPRHVTVTNLELVAPHFVNPSHDGPRTLRITHYLFFKALSMKETKSG